MPAGAVSLFPTCLGDLVAPESVEAAVRVLEACGCRVAPVAGATCCGQPAYNSGFDADARRVARRTLRAIPDGSEPVIVPAGSCAAMMHHHWPRLFHGTRDAARAQAVASRVVEWSAFTAEHGEVLAARGLRWPGRVVYHDSCHMLRELGIHEAPRTLLGLVDGLELVEVPSSARCCGFGGTFSVRYPDVSVAMADSKLADLESAGATALVSCDGGCLMHLGGRQSRVGGSARTIHLATLLDEAMGR
jgi:L-lactate dehydrogenase complex protein LldE